MKVVSEQPHHLDSLPHEPEKFYNTGTGNSILGAACKFTWDSSSAAI
jgi:hypothetical protein